MLVDDALVNAVYLLHYLSVSASLVFMIRLHSATSSSFSPLVISASSVLLLLLFPLPFLPLFLPLPETLSTNKGADLLIWGLCGCCLEGCEFVCVGE